MTRARDLADSADKDIAGTLTLDDLTVDNNVGIGTSSPDAKLHINESAAAGTGIFLTNDNNTSGTYSDIRWQYSPSDPSYASGIRFKQLDTTHGGQLEFFTDNTVGTYTQRMTITEDGYVGIGTSSPSATLTVSQGANNIFAVERTGVGSGSGQFGINIESNSQTTMSYDDGAPLVIGTASNPSTHVGFSERMRIDQAGRVTMPYQPSWSLARGGAAYYTTSAGAIINFSNTTSWVGRHNIQANSNGAGRVTVIKDGRYQINVTAYYKRSGSSNDSYIYLRINGTADIWAGSSSARTDTYYDTITLTYVVDLSANDYLEIHSGANTFDVYGASTFSGFLIG